MRHTIKNFIEGQLFQNVIICLIVINAIILGF